MELDDYSCSLTLKLLPNFMNTIESGKVYPLDTSILFLAPIAFGASSLCDTHLRQLSKVLNLRQEVTNDELKTRMAAIWEYRDTFYIWYLF